MASNSKKRRRVLGVSCILAALIIASSSFAWFTSSDEVTNRLTASADYGVSIIENFAPPKQWTPGQTVTKEEAVTNTGNVDAFVKQQITADMEVTVEVPVATAPTANKGYIELTPAEYGAIEAGSYVAWSPDGTEIGRKVVYAMDKTAEGGHSDSDTTDFKPQKTGLYIFRRAITTEKETNATTGNETLKDTAYDYVGYYYVLNDENDPTKGGTYYKLNTIDKNSLVLAASGNGDLAQAPTVRYSIEETRTLKNVPMVYNGTAPDGVKLTVTYDANRSSASNAMETADKAAYDAYNKYLDDLKGATKWDDTRGSSSYAGVGTDTQHTPTKSLDPDNHTGLIDFDEFTTAIENDIDKPKADLSNFSLDRLTERATETQTILDNVSPGGNYAGNNAVNWTTVYEDAVADRKTVNKGVRSAQRLDKLKTELLGMIGNGANNGLHQADTYGFFYSTDLIDSNGKVVAPTVTLTNSTANYRNQTTNSDSNGTFLTLDDMNDTTGNYATSNFAESNITEGANVAIDADGDSLAKFSSVDTNFGAKFDYAGAADTANGLKDLWDKYVIATKKQVLIDAKIDLVNRAIAASADSTTDVGRTPQELQEILATLTSQKRVIDEGLTTAKTAYENFVLGTPTQKGIKDYIDEMNEDQKDINAANEVDAERNDAANGNPFGKDVNYKGDKSDAAKYPTPKSSVLNGGTTETLSEETLEQYLINVYGVAYKDAEGSADAKVYTGDKYNDTMDQTTNAKWSTDTGADLYANILTYSPTVTENKVKACLEEGKDGTTPNGKIVWKENTTVDTQLGTNDSSRQGKKDDIEKAPYYLDWKADMMKAKRETDVAADLADYNNKKATAVSTADSDAAAQPIVINVNLANINDGTDKKDTWQYIADATDANEYNFYYTSILGSGETSKLLIKSVDMGANVDQNSFRNLKFDLNVGSESAQVIYDGDYAKAEAANATITGANTTEEKYTTTGPVMWEKDDAATPPTVENPQGKASTEVNGTETSVYGKIGDGAANQYTVEKVPATIVSGNSYIYKITATGTYAGTYYGNSTAVGSEFKKIADVPATAPFAFLTGDDAKTIKLCDAPAP